MRTRYFIYVVLVAAAVAIQWPLWFGKGGILRMVSLEEELTQVRASNDKLRAENDNVAAEIESLESGSGAVEERARMRMGMIRNDEILFRFVPLGAKEEPSRDQESAQTADKGGPKLFAPKRGDLYIDGAFGKERASKKQ